MHLYSYLEMAQNKKIQTEEKNDKTKRLKQKKKPSMKVFPLIFFLGFMIQGGGGAGRGYSLQKFYALKVLKIMLLKHKYCIYVQGVIGEFNNQREFFIVFGFLIITNFNKQVKIFPHANT